MRLRLMIIGGVSLVVAAVVIAGFLHVTATPERGELVEGVHYRLIEGAGDVTEGGPIEVREFFSWGCIHCYNFEKHVQQWLANKPDDVVFQRTPVSFTPAWAVLARAYIAMDALGIVDDNFRRMFVAIHDQRRPLSTPEAIGDYLVGTDGESFARAMRSPRVQRAWQRAEQRAREVGLTGVPALTVADRYYVSVGDVGAGIAFRIVDELIERERARRAATPPPGK